MNRRERVKLTLNDNIVSVPFEIAHNRVDRGGGVRNKDTLVGMRADELGNALP